MKQMVFSACAGLLLAIGVGVANAQDYSKLSETELKQVNGWMAERAEVLVGAHKIEAELGQAWGDPKYTSPEVESLRSKYRELQHELSMTQLELRKKVEELPAVQARRRQLEEEKKRAEALAKKVEQKVGKRE